MSFGIKDNTKMGQLERAAKEDYIKSLEPNPNDPRNKNFLEGRDIRARKGRFAPLNDEEQKRSLLLDHLGNPKEGYKWGEWNKEKKWYEIIKVE